jgi:hypothetical protein
MHSSHYLLELSESSPSPITASYRQGSLPEITANDTAFISAVQKYLGEKNLASLIGIEVLGGDGTARDMQEFVLSDSHGTVMMEAKTTKASKPSRLTGWAFVQNGDGITELKGNQYHAETVKGPHKVLIDAKMLRDVGGGVEGIDEEVVTDALRREQVID